ncbi:MAG TPA: DUF2628 domain-containing protein [Stenotrophomonas sp.]|nr:DUF2628 domain-containing protein [Stenotrophomonas sp.]
MNDPYNSVGSRMPPPVDAAAATVRPARPVRDPIAALNVSETWKKRFRAIEKAGGPSMPRQRELLPAERRSVGFNGWAFLFGALYYLAKGLWRQALAYSILIVAICLAVTAMGFGGSTSFIGTFFAVIFAMRANVSYYQAKVLGEAPWF